MKLNYLVILGAMSLTFGCIGQTKVSQTPANSPIVNTAAKTIKLGTFIAGEHKTTGSVRIFTLDSKTYLELDKAFNTSNLGPDLHIILHRSADVLASTSPPAYPVKKTDYVLVDRLQKYAGSQLYAVPKNINLENYQSAVIWCRKFNATFGTAKLRS